MTANRADFDPPQAFQPTGRFDWPAMPTEDAVKRFVGPILRRLRNRDDAPHVAKDRLRRTSFAVGEAITPTPACDILLRELGATLDDWAGNADARPARDADSLRLLILPPCEESSLLEHWATANGHRLVAPPRMDLTMLDLGTLDPGQMELIDPQPHHALRARLVDLVPDLRPRESGEVFVIPGLERWFLRHRHGLALVRALLEELDTSTRRCVVGCNSWAWLYLQKAIGADLVLPRGLTFRAFDAARLRSWFGELGDDELATLDDEVEPADMTGTGKGGPLCFRLATNGKAILQIPAPGGGSSQVEAGDDFFRALAAHSLGVPWIAWRTWRESLRARIEDQQATATVDASGSDKLGHPADAGDGTAQGRTIWIADFETFLLPPGREQDSLLVLHALLLHDSLASPELRAVLPNAQAHATVPALLSAGFIERDDSQRLRCRALAYPAIRRTLEAAGYPVDRL